MKNEDYFALLMAIYIAPYLGPWWRAVLFAGAGFGYVIAVWARWRSA